MLAHWETACIPATCRRSWSQWHLFRTAQLNYSEATSRPHSDWPGPPPAAKWRPASVWIGSSEKKRAFNPQDMLLITNTTQHVYIWQRAKTLLQLFLRLTTCPPFSKRGKSCFFIFRVTKKSMKSIEVLFLAHTLHFHFIPPSKQDMFLLHLQKARILWSEVTILIPSNIKDYFFLLNYIF